MQRYRLLHLAVTSGKNFIRLAALAALPRFDIGFYSKSTCMNPLPHLRCILLFTLLLLALASCKMVEDDVVVVTLSPEYSVDLFEQRSAADGTPQFGLWVESMANYPCPGYSVDAQVTVQNGNIGVVLLGVLAPAICEGDSAPAKQFLPIGNLADGTYTFSISLRDVIVNKGALSVTNGQYKLSLPNTQGVFIENFILDPLPDGIIWGYAATPDEPSEPVADNFLTDLKTLSIENDLPPGFYSYFKLSGTGNISLHKSIAPAGVSRPFVRRLTASNDALKGLLQGYRDAAQPLQIKCWTTEGEF